jgi:hypothetical protein
MPRGDRTGPMGAGTGTGRGLGRKRGWRHRFSEARQAGGNHLSIAQPKAEETMQDLLSETDRLKAKLEAINKRIDELKIGTGEIHEQ